MISKLIPDHDLAILWIRAISAKGIGTFNSLGGVERLESHGLGEFVLVNVLSCQ